MYVKILNNLLVSSSAGIKLIRELCNMIGSGHFWVLLETKNYVCHKMEKFMENLHKKILHD